MTTLKILMVNYEFPPIGGGGAKAHLCILREFAKVPDLQVDVLTSAQSPGFYEDRFSENIIVYKLGLHKKELHYWRKSEVVEWLLKTRRPYRRLLRTNQYDLVHAFFGFPSGYLCYRTAKQIPYIVSLRGSDVPGQNRRLQLEYRLLGPLFKAIWRKANVLAACSQGLRKRALDFMHDAKINVIPNGVDIDRFLPAIRNGSYQPLKLLTVGRLSITKRVDMLIEAVELLRKKGREVTLTIVGSGSLEQEIKDIILKKDLGDYIKATGRVEAESMPRLYQEHAIFVSATMQEGMSNAMLEAMASGLPIITTRCEGLDELINGNGIVVENPTAESIAESVNRIVDDIALYRKMSDMARKKAEQFSWSSVAGQYLQLYTEVLSGNERELCKASAKRRTASRLQLAFNVGRRREFSNFLQIEKEPERILVATAAGIGDTIMVAPAVAALKRRFPGANIDALVHYNRGSQEVYELMPCVNDIINFPIKSYRWSGVIKFMFRKFWSLLFRLRKGKYEMVVFFTPNIIRRLLLAAIGAEYWIYGNRLNDYPGEIAFELLAPLQIERGNKEKVFDVPQPQNSERMLPSNMRKPVIGVHPFCGIKWKQWNKFNELLERLSGFDATVVLIGKEENHQPSTGFIDLVNKTNLRELFWVVSRLDLLITADAGPMHISLALDIPTVALFGFVPPELLISKDALKTHKILYKRQPGQKRPLRVKERERLDDSLMQAITVEEVLQEAGELLSQRKGINLKEKSG